MLVCRREEFVSKQSGVHFVVLDLLEEVVARVRELHFDAVNINN